MPAGQKKGVLPARFELAAFGFLFFEQSYSTRYETDVITDYTKEAKLLNFEL